MKLDTKKKLSKIIRSIIFALCMIIFISPLFIMISSSLKTYNELTLWPPRLFGFEPQWTNYLDVLQGETSILPALKNSLIVSISSSVICVSFGVLAAYAVTRFEFKGRSLFLFAILATQLFAAILLVNPMYIIFRDLGILNTLLALIIANTAVCLPMTVWLLYSYLSSIPLALEEASFLDGCSRLQSIVHILVPLLIPGIISAGLFAFIMSWGDIIFANTFIFDSNLQPISIKLINFRSLYQTRWELQLAAGLIASIPVFILFMFIQKHLVKNMAFSGIKS